MGRYNEHLSVREKARQILSLVDLEVVRGNALPRVEKKIVKALALGNGYAIATDYDVLAYAEIQEHEEMFILRSVVVKDSCRDKDLGTKIVSNRIEYASAINPNKPVCLVCPTELADFYLSLGFINMSKAGVPDELLGSRSQKEWQESNRVWIKKG